MRRPLICSLIMTVLAVPLGASAQPSRAFRQAQIALGPLISPVARAPGAIAPQVYTRSRAAAVELLLDDRLDGTGFIIDAKGRMITAAHVVETPRERIEARTIYGRVNAKLLALDLGHDLALLQLDPPPNGGSWPTLPIAERTPAVTSTVYLFGTPQFRHHVLIQGMIARDMPTYEYLPDLQRYISILHLSAPSPGGTSGGPWMNSEGEVIGVQSGMMLTHGSPVGLAYMVPLGAIQALVRRGVDARTPSAGVAVEEIWEQPREYLRQFPAKTQGVVVKIKHGPALDVDLKHNDLIIQIDGRRTPLRDDLLGYIRAKSAGETVTLTVLRGREARRVKITLDSLERRARN